MHIMVDANIVISAGMFPGSRVGAVLSHIAQNHNLVLCRYTLEESADVFERKFPSKIQNLNELIDELEYERVDTDIINYDGYPKMRDTDDIPLLACAIEADVDILVTGDKDFDDVQIVKPRIMKPREYIDEFMIIKP